MRDAAEDLRSRLEADRKDLLDLSLRNPLLNYRPRARSLEFVGEAPPELFRLLVREGRTLTFLPAPARGPAPSETPGEEPAPGVPPADPTDLKPQTALPAEELQARLLAIYHAARTAIEEQGVNTLFLALGMLRWSEEGGDAKILLAPLVLVPVELSRSHSRERFCLRHDGEDLDVNLSLAEKLREDFGIDLPAPAEPEELDVVVYLDAVAEAIRERPGWSVDRDSAVLGFFSFSKFLMYRDLDAAGWPSGETPAEHPVVGALLGEGFRESAPAIDEDEPLDRHPALAGLRLVLDADGTQTLALLDAAEGRNLVIQGPPGTGKSQTITNLIADAIGRGKTVLFVAEKMAALEVVKRRLDAVGLGEACLELHGHKLSKKAVLDQIRRTLGVGRPRRAPAEDDLRELAELRDRLDRYAEAINTPIGDSGVSPHWAIGEWLQLRSEQAPGDPPRPEIAALPTWTASEFRRRLELVESLHARLRSLGELRSHPFFGSRRAEWLPGDADRLRERLRTARHAASALREAASALARFLRLPAPSTRAACELLLKSARRVGEASRWQGAQVRGEWLSRRDDLRALLDAGSALAELHRRHDAVLLPHAWDRDVSEIRRVLNVRGRSWWRLLSPEYREARDRLASLCRAAPPARLDEQLALLDAVTEARRLREVIRAQEPLAARLFGRRWRGEVSDWRALSALAEGLHGLHLDVREGRLPRGLLDFLADAPALAGLETLDRAVESALAAQLAAVGRLLESLEFDEAARFGGEGGLAELDFGEQEAVLEGWSRSIDTLEALAGYNRLAARCREAGLAGLVALAETWPDAGRFLTSAFRRQWFEGLLRRAYRERPELADFDGASHERAIATFRELDRRALAHDRARIARSHWEKLPRHDAGGQLGTLRRELAKKARHLPVRQLMTRAGNAVQAIKPVFLMSPLSVAAYLPPGLLAFDLVVFDEASQVRPVDALGALLRGRQAVVVGDARQLPPTQFFDRLTGGDDRDDDEETSADVESILGLFSAQGAPERMLRWHYRSRHESLIAVSNREFYDGRLVVFPSPDAGRTEAGLIFRHLPETAYDRGRTRTNPGEAEAVARAVLDFAREQMSRPSGSRRSLGVATFSAAQMRAVLDRIERLRSEDPSCEPFFDPGADEPFFVKNLENVQGDERDVIFLSVGYGRTAEGTLSMNFGPLNGEGGERRLNVLITRARVRCEVFTNLTADDIDPGRGRSRGVQALRAFLAYAQSGRFEGPSDRAPEADRPFESSVRALLSEAGHRIETHLGSDIIGIDMALLDPDGLGRCLLGLAADGPSYREARSARDRDRLTPEVLEGLGWRLRRLWSPDWLRDPDGERGRLLAAIEEMRATPGDGPPERCEPAPQAPDEAPGEKGGATSPIEPADPEAPRPGVLAYRLAELPAEVAGLDLAAEPVGRLTGWVVEVVRVEGPVHVAEVTRRIADAAGVKRLGPRIQDAIESACSHAIEAGSIRREGDFLRPPGLAAPPIRDRGALPASSRRLDLVATEEIALAVERVVLDAFGMEPAAVPAAACRLLGFPKLGDEMRRRVEAIIADLVHQGRLVAKGDHLVIPDLRAAG